MSPFQQQSPTTIGRYRIVRPIGSGAMGDVYLATDPHIDRQLALKTVRVIGANEADIEERKERLLREAKAAGKLLHPNVVALFDAAEADGLLYLAFEYVAGVDLSKRAASQPPLTLRQVLNVALEVATALDFAHRHEIVHRDIKPSNILLGPGGEAKVADFGIAKVTGSTELTRTGSVVGSPQYMSPEQVRGETLDGRSDLFSLGVVLYELVCRLRPFGGDTLSTLVFEILAKEPPTVDQMRPGLPARLVSLIHRLLAKDRDQRPATAAEVVAELQQILGSTPAAHLEAPASPQGASEDQTVRIASSGSVATPPIPPTAQASAVASHGSIAATATGTPFPPPVPPPAGASPAAAPPTGPPPTAAPGTAAPATAAPPAHPSYLPPTTRAPLESPARPSPLETGTARGTGAAGGGLRSRGLL
ncbi:MAG: serine/threonine-protein kinase, partial [Acidobacteriota bacterium]